MTDENDKKSKSEALRGLWADLEAERIQEEGEKKTEAELAEELKAAGAEPAMDRAHANIMAMFEKAKQESNVRDIRSARRWSTLNMITSAAGAFAAAACIILVLGKLNGLPTDLYPTNPVPTAGGGNCNRTVAETAYDIAVVQCATDEYPECLAGLESARKYDPDIVNKESAYYYLREKARREVMKMKDGGTDQ